MLRQFEETEQKVGRLIALQRFILAVLNIASEYLEINKEYPDLLSDISHRSVNEIHAVVYIKWLKDLLTLIWNLCDKLLLHIISRMPLLSQIRGEIHLIILA